MLCEYPAEWLPCSAEISTLIGLRPWFQPERPSHGVRVPAKGYRSAERHCSHKYWWDSLKKKKLCCYPRRSLFLGNIYSREGESPMTGLVTLAAQTQLVYRTGSNESQSPDHCDKGLKAVKWGEVVCRFYMTVLDIMWRHLSLPRPWAFESVLCLGDDKFPVD